MQRINRITIDSTHAVSDLCELGTLFPTDKSPYIDGKDAHRHSYTAVYDLIFASKRLEPIIFGEIGVLSNMSMRMWRAYFPNATLYGFDVFPDVIENARNDGLLKTHYSLADISDVQSVYAALNATQQSFDIIIDDSTHLL